MKESALGLLGEICEEARFHMEIHSTSSDITHRQLDKRFNFVHVCFYSILVCQNKL